MKFKQRAFLMRYANQTSIDCIIDILTDSSLDQLSQLTEMKNVMYDYAILLKEKTKNEI